MKVFALSDLHLSFSELPHEGIGVLHKPMSVFGENWEKCYKKIYDNCCQLLSDKDYLLCAGDISWAMDLEETQNDFAFLESLPCKLIMIKGNHDYWWQSVSRVRKALPQNCTALQNDAVVLEDKVVIAGTRGWILPSASDWKQHDAKILNREVLRLEMSLAEASKSNLPIIAMMHYPPLIREEETVFTEVLSRYNVQKVVYGHLHGVNCGIGFEGDLGGINYKNTAADKVDFCPVLVWEE